jgi:hypothetical protein
MIVMIYNKSSKLAYYDRILLAAQCSRHCPLYLSLASEQVIHGKTRIKTEI